MNSIRAFIKDVFYRANLTAVLDYLLYQFSIIRNKKKNTAFRKAHPELIIPPDYFLYETYRLDYKQFFEDTKNTAEEILLWTKSYIKQGQVKILDWGCGISRVAMTIDEVTPPTTSVYACDINVRMIEFNARHYKNVSYSVISYEPPTRFDSNFFGFVYSLSVFTHIEASLQPVWIKEIHRILQEDGVFLFTTHGRYYDSKLLPRERRLLEQRGVFTKSFLQKGHRMMSTYNSAAAFRNLLQPYFDVLEFHDGALDQSRTGGQDQWIVRKKTV